MRHQSNRKVAKVLLLVDVISLMGCQRAPSIDVLGSFFPAWLLCLVLGIVLTTGTRFLLLKLHLEEALSPPVLMYACATALFTFALWLLFFHGGDLMELEQTQTTNRKAVRNLRIAI